MLITKKLTKTYDRQQTKFDAVHEVDFSLDAGQLCALTGPSGCGKSTFFHLISGLTHADSGEILFEGKDLCKLSAKEWTHLRATQISYVLQGDSLLPNFTVLENICLPHRLCGEYPDLEKQAMQLLEEFGMEAMAQDYPTNLSGGERRRVAVARAVVHQPKLVIADEPTTALDVTIQAQVLELLQHLRRESNTSIIMITHDLGVIASMCSRILVMYGGIICEQGTAREIFYQPRHPYTWGLLRSIPGANGNRGEKLIPINGTPPDMLRPPKGCPFAPRCPHAMPVCRAYLAPEMRISDTHVCACHLMHPRAPKIERGV